MSVELGEIVVAKTGPGEVYASGKVVAISMSPQVLIEQEDGTKVWWRRDMCVVAQRCGTCRHYAPEEESTPYGSCWFPESRLPMAITEIGIPKLLLLPNKGTTCPCWEAKE